MSYPGLKPILFSLGNDHTVHTTTGWFVRCITALESEKLYDIFRRKAVLNITSIKILYSMCMDGFWDADKISYAHAELFFIFYSNKTQ